MYRNYLMPWNIRYCKYIQNARLEHPQIASSAYNLTATKASVELAAKSIINNVNLVKISAQHKNKLKLNPKHIDTPFKEDKWSLEMVKEH